MSTAYLPKWHSQISRFLNKQRAHVGLVVYKHFYIFGKFVCFTVVFAAPDPSVYSNSRLWQNSVPLPGDVAMLCHALLQKQRQAEFLEGRYCTTGSIVNVHTAE